MTAEQNLGQCLVIGANGFLGGHVTRQLVAAGQDTAVLHRENADTRILDGLKLRRITGSCFDPETLRAALAGIDTVFYCVVDTRSWLRDAGPLWQTNVESLKPVLEICAEFPLKKFVFTSSFVTIGLKPEGVADENTAFNWQDWAPDYVLTRVEAERLVLEAARSTDLPAISCNVSNTYGPLDYAPTPHGRMLWDAARGKMPLYFAGGAESIGIEDAASALLVAAAKGERGQRYIVSDRFVTMRELFTLACEAAGRKPPAMAVPVAFMFGLSWMAEITTRLRGKDNPMAPSSIRLLRATGPVSSEKIRALGWQPKPLVDSIDSAVDFYQQHFGK